MTIQINGTSGISGVDGSAATPALQGSDTNTGISFGTDEVNINTGGSTAVTVDAFQRVGIGTTIASDRLTIGDTADTFTSVSVKSTNTGVGEIRFADPDSTNSGHVKYDHSINSLIFATNSTERVKITQEGYLRVHNIPAMYGDNFDWVNTNAKMHAGFIFYDTTSSWNNTTGVYTCPVDGKYLVCADVQGHQTSIQTGASGTYYNIVPFKNGSTYGAESVATSKDGTGSTNKHDCVAFSLVIAANANDTIEVRSNHGFRSNTQNHLTIVYLG
jgi:hypothetical protein